MSKWGIAGTGFISHAMLGAIARREGSEAVAISGRSAETRVELQAQYGIGTGVETVAELAALPDVDAIYIGLPNHLHREASEVALAAGKAVLCEKSLTTTNKDAEALADAAKSSGQFFVEGLMYLAHPIYQTLVDVLQSEDVGELRHITGFYAADIWQVVNPAGKGTLYNLGCYPASLMQMVVQAMCGEEVFSARDLTAKGNVNEDGNICDTAVSVRFGNGVLASLHSTDSYGMAHEFVIATTKGTIRFDYNPWLPDAEANGFTWRGYDGSEKRFSEDAPGDAFDHQLEMVEASLATGLTQALRPSPRLKDSVEIMRFLNDWEAACT